jgi:hypothetical protein
MGRATYELNASLKVRSDNKEHKMARKGSKETDIPHGDGKADVTVGKEFKEWKSYDNGGFTVGASVSVKLSCNQDGESIENAAVTAGEFAEDMALGAIEEMQKKYLG